MANISREHWGSKIGFILAAAGSAIGLGNVWKFPYITGANGGAAFIIVYLGFILLLGLPILITEIVIGRHTGKDPVGAFKTLAPNSIWKNTGYIAIFTAFIIVSFYSVVGGWTLGYIVKSVLGEISKFENIKTSGGAFNNFIGNPFSMIFYHFLFLLTCLIIIQLGVKKGIERYSKILMPIFLFLIVLIIIRGLMMPGSFKGVSFLLDPDFSKLSWSAVIDALGHSFFTLSLGMGTMITYGSYLNKKEKILSSSVYIAILDTVIALLAGFAIFPAVFAMNMDPSGGPGLIFSILPVVFSNIPYGAIFAFIFFVLLFIAALTSAISMIEVVVAYLVDEKKWSRPKATYSFGFVIFLIGIPAALSFGAIKDFKIFFGYNFFDFLDKLTSNIMLPAGGLLFAIFLGWKYGLNKTMHELDQDTSVTVLKKVWAVTVKFVSPVLLLFVMIYPLMVIIYNYLKK